MARMPRLHLPGGFYHVTLRGNHRHPIFFDPADRRLLERITARSLGELGARLHAYCWMTNHVHMLVQVAQEPLGRLMMRIASAYARIVQSRLETTGHLFERRYHALLVDADSYLLTLLRYIHMNPVRAGLAREPGDYPWSSHRDYLGVRSRDWLTTGFALRMFGPNERLARARYRAFMGSPAVEKWGTGHLVPNQRNGGILGGDEFVAKVCPQANGGSHLNLDQILVEAERRFRVSRELLSSCSRSRRLSAARVWIASEARRSRAASISAVARLMGRSEASLRQLVQRHRSLAEDE
jgi:REP element-mobilizing transposase RayT